MRDSAFGGDRAAEQLYDELLARMFALDSFLPSEGLDIGAPGRCFGARKAAVDAVRELRSPDPWAAAARVERLLWPNGDMPPASRAWWSTPLGALLLPLHVGRRRAPGSDARRQQAAGSRIA